MKLPVWRQLPYVSPSTFMKWETCQHRVYLSRLAGLKFHREPQGLAAAIGSAFDSFIKDYIANKRGIKAGALELNNLLSKTVDKEHQDTAIPKGKEICKIYVDLGLAKQFIDMNTEIRLDQEMYYMHHTIPILGQIDLIFSNMPMDWKTGGFATEKGSYCVKGWDTKIDIKDGRIKNYESNIHKPLEETHPAWATQMCFYNWMLRNVEQTYLMHEIKQHNGTISFAVRRGRISKEFEEDLFARLNCMWSNITGEMFHAHIQEPTPSNWVCRKYNVLCEVATDCVFYMRTLGDPDNLDAQP